jgi:Flp pilus assembly protein TadD
MSLVTAFIGTGRRAEAVTRFGQAIRFSSPAALVDHFQWLTRAAGGPRAGARRAGGAAPAPSRPRGPRTIPVSHFPGPRSARVAWVDGLAVAGVTALVFLRSIGHDFVAWDDEALLVNNPAFRGLGWAHLRWMVGNTMLGHYVPVAWLSFAVDHEVWGLASAGYHLTNVLLHAANAVLVYGLVVRLLGRATAWTDHARRVGAIVTALLWAIHPLRVEAVSWVTGRRDVLSAFFFLLALLAYLEAAFAPGARRRRWLVGVVWLYALALGSKAIVMTAPVALVALDVYPLRRLSASVRRWGAPEFRGVWLEKIPLAVLAVLSASASAIAVERGGGYRVLGIEAWLGKLSTSLATPLWKTMWPLSLSPLYELPGRIDLRDAAYWADGVLVFGVSLAVFALRERWPAGATAWVWYLAFLAPVSTAAHAGPQIAADRYGYLPILGPLVLVGAAVGAVAEGWRATRVSQAVALSVGVGAVGIMCVLASLTWRQQAIWRDTGRLWAHAVAVAPDCFVCHGNLGNWFMRHDRVAEAIVQYEVARALNREHTGVRSNLAQAMMRIGRPAEAIPHYDAVLHQSPHTLSVRVDLASALVATGQLSAAVGRLDEAARFSSPAALVDYFQRMTTTQPTAPVLRLGLLQAYVRVGDHEQAREAYEALAGLHPALALASRAGPVPPPVPVRS